MMEVHAKVIKYENFLNERLRSDLKKVLDRRDVVYSDLADYLQLRNITEKLQEQQQGQQKEEVKTLVDLGCNFYAHARVSDPSHICVAVGYGFFVEFTLDEALAFIDRKTAYLTEQAQRLTAEASEISARVKLVMEALKELQFGNQPPPQQSPRAVW